MNEAPHNVEARGGRRLKIAVDARYLTGRPSGIGRYSESLLLALARLKTEHTWHVLVQPGYQPPEALRGAMQWHAVALAPIGQGTLLRVGGLIDALRCDVAHVHCPLVPLRLQTPLVVTFHDWQPLTEPEFSAGRPWPLPQCYTQFYRWAYPRAARRARAIVNVSEATRAETVRFVPESAGRARAILSGLDDFFRQPASATECAAVRQRFALPKRYLLYVGSTRPNKHLPLLLETYAQLKAGGERAGLVLVLTKDRFWGAAEAALRRLGLEREVCVLEGLDETALRAIYREAALFTMAATGEGFGFPLLEAMAQGVPTVIRAAGSLPELAGEAGICVPGGDAEALAEVWLKLLNEKELAERLGRAGAARAALFRWEDAARQTLAVLEQAAEKDVGA
jgi:glycosyltransferase involved in cell wall biosynthesis